MSAKTLTDGRVRSAPFRPSRTLYSPHPCGSPLGQHSLQTSAILPMFPRCAGEETTWLPRTCAFPSPAQREKVPKAEGGAFSAPTLLSIRGEREAGSLGA